MRKTLFLPIALLCLPLLLTGIACSDANPLDPSAEAELALTTAEKTAGKLNYSFTLSRDWLCGPGEGCILATIRETPGGITFFEGFRVHFFATGDFTGEFWVMDGKMMVNTSTGEGIINGTVLFDLTEPGIGTIECLAHSSFVGSLPPYSEYVERVKYTACKGTGDFEGIKMKAWADNAANPGTGIYDGIAELF